MQDSAQKGMGLRNGAVHDGERLSAASNPSAAAASKHSPICVSTSNELRLALSAPIVDNSNTVLVSFHALRKGMV